MQKIEKETIQKLKILNKISLKYVIGRVFLAVIFLLLFFLSIEIFFKTVLQLVILVIFLIVVFYNNRLNGKISFFINKKLVIEDEKNKCNGIQDDRPVGMLFKDRLHDFAHDLNVFGDFSLFHFINRSYSFLGHYCLAKILKKNQISIVENKLRQDLIQKLEREKKWMIDLFTHTKIIECKTSIHFKAKPLEPDVINKFKSVHLLKYPKWLFYVQLFLISGIVLSSFYSYALCIFLLMGTSALNYSYNKKGHTYIKRQAENINKVLLYCSALIDIAKHCKTLRIESKLYNQFLLALDSNGGFITQAKDLKQ